MPLKLPPRRMLISYAQNFEDVLLYRAFSHLENGFYVDIGAFDPTIGSVTKAFYDRGWNGINIEPSSVFGRLSADRPRDINLNIAILDREGEVDFVENADDQGTSHIESSAGADKVGEARTYRVACDRLDNVLAQHAAGRLINFLKIDVEGAEATILNSTDWTKIRPQILVIEATTPWTNDLVSHEWEGSLLSSGYKRAYFDGLNLFFVRDEDADLLRHFDRPVNVLDWFLKFDPSDLPFFASHFANVSGGSTRSFAGALFEHLRETALQLEAVSPQRRGLADDASAGIDAKQTSPSKAPAPLDPEKLLQQLRAAMSFAAEAERFLERIDRALHKRRDIAERGAGTVVAVEPERLLQEIEAIIAVAARYDAPRNVAPGQPAATPVSATAPDAGAARLRRRALAKTKSMLRRMVSRLIGPLAWRTRRFLIDPLTPMLVQLDAVSRDLNAVSRDVEALRRELARIDGLSPELVRSIEAALLTAAVSRSSR